MTRDSPRLNPPRPTRPVDRNDERSMAPESLSPAIEGGSGEALQERTSTRKGGRQRRCRGWRRRTRIGVVGPSDGPRSGRSQIPSILLPVSLGNRRADRAHTATMEKEFETRQGSGLEETRSRIRWSLATIAAVATRSRRHDQEAGRADRRHPDGGRGAAQGSGEAADGSLRGGRACPHAGRGTGPQTHFLGLVAPTRPMGPDPVNGIGVISMSTLRATTSACCAGPIRCGDVGLPDWPARMPASRTSSSLSIPAARGFASPLGFWFAPEEDWASPPAYRVELAPTRRPGAMSPAGNGSRPSRRAGAFASSWRRRHRVGASAGQPRAWPSSRGPFGPITVNETAWPEAREAGLLAVATAWRLEAIDGSLDRLTDDARAGSIAAAGPPTRGGPGSPGGPPSRWPCPDPRPSRVRRTAHRPGAVRPFPGGGALYRRSAASSACSPGATGSTNESRSSKASSRLSSGREHRPSIALQVGSRGPDHRASGDRRRPIDDLRPWE